MQPKRGVALLVGDVDYDRLPEDRDVDKNVSAEPSSSSVLRAAIRGHRGIHWEDLPGTGAELKALRAMASMARADVGELIVRTGDRAGTTEVLLTLPLARWAHFATHGFFADSRFRTMMELSQDLFESEPRVTLRERTTVAGRNPLLLSGLVLAGANLPPETDERGIPRGDGGLLTGEAIAGLSATKLELVVLSACDTGLGDVASEGVLGLQRAFHMAGAKNVVASLWKVDDNATAALMSLFYHKMWVQGESPIDALRSAQLSIHHNSELVNRLIADPELLDKVARSRGGDLKREGGDDPATNATKLWAAFVLSGPG